MVLTLEKTNQTDYQVIAVVYNLDEAKELAAKDAAARFGESTSMPYQYVVWSVDNIGPGYYRNYVLRLKELKVTA